MSVGKSVRLLGVKTHKRHLKERAIERSSFGSYKVPGGTTKLKTMLETAQ